MSIFFRVALIAAIAFNSFGTQAQTSTTLVTGWNLLGNGNALSLEVAAPSLFGDAARVASVWKWIPASKKWAIYVPSLNSQSLSDYALSKGYDVLTTVAAGEGFWVNTKTSFSVVLPSTSPVLATSMQAGLLAGWNLVAIGETKNPGDFGTTTLWAWDGSRGAWYFYAPSLEANGTLAAYIQSNSYLDFASNGKKLGPGVGFWINNPETTTLAPPTNLIVSNTGTQTVGTQTFSSSTKLSVSWTAPAYSVDHYVVSALEAIQNTTVTASTAASARSATITGLKSATAYRVSVKACVNSSCDSGSTSTAIAATTGTEVWQIQGTGHAWNTAKEVISDSNTKAWAFAYGPGAGTGLEGTARLYYDPDFSDPNQKGVKIGYTASTATTNPSSVNSFVAATGYGLRYKDPQNAAIKNNYEIQTNMAVPLSAAMGGKIRLFFEFTYTARGNRYGIYYIDSQDGYVGLDYNKSSATVCSTDAEFAVGGDCAPTLAIGSSSQGFTGIDTARQFKLGYPTLTDWRWNGDSGTFMLFSMNTANGACATNTAGVGYAQWDGSKWSVSNTDGCPKYWDHMQAPVPVHLGGVKYKMYYGHSDLSDTTCTSTNTMLGAKKVLYADGAVSGNVKSVEFEDWEAKTNQRDITFLWPDGAEVDSCSAKKFDDFVVYMPTYSTDYQVMYMANELLWLAMAVLLNP